MRGREDLDCQEPHSSSDNFPCPKRVGRGGVMPGDVGEGREGVLQLWGKQVSSFLELVHAFRVLFTITLPQNRPESDPCFPSHCYSPRHLFAPSCASVSSRGLPRPSSVLRTWGVTVRSQLKSLDSTSFQDPASFTRSLPSPPPHPPGFQLVLSTTCSAWHALALKCHSSYEALPSNPVRRNPSFIHMPISTSWIFFILHPNLVHCLVYNTTSKCELTDKDYKIVDLFRTIVLSIVSGT